MERKNAINMICEQELKVLSPDDKYDLLLNWWSIDESDIEFHELSNELQNVLRTSDEPSLGEVSHSLFEPLILIALRYNYYGVQNEYLIQKLHALSIGHDSIEGNPEETHQCPCCLYYTLKERGIFDICPVCFWEDSGYNKPEAYSGVNHMFLSEAQANFESLGAISLSAKKSVDPNERNKWTRDKGT